ncbi:MAG TPA: hypothetical protein VJ179_01485 [Patescibacteria group bacterium]|nr:hypothetical protein [Patescibacteria group bacterium]
MNYLLAPGILFSTLYTLLFSYIGFRFLQISQKNNNPVAKMFGISCFFFGLSVFAIAVPQIFFPGDMKQLGFWGETVSWAITQLGLAFMAVNFSYTVFPQVQGRTIWIITATISACITIITFFSPIQAEMSEYGYPLFQSPPLPFFLNNLLLAFIAFPLAFVFLKKAARRRYLAKALLLTFGIILVALFEPTTHEVQSFSLYILFNLFSLAGFALLIIGVNTKSEEVAEA